MAAKWPPRQTLSVKFLLPLLLPSFLSDASVPLCCSLVPIPGCGSQGLFEKGSGVTLLGKGSQDSVFQPTHDPEQPAYIPHKDFWANHSYLFSTNYNRLFGQT